MSDLSHAIKADKSGVLAELVALIKAVLWAHLFGHSQDEKAALLNHPAFAALEPDAPAAPAAKTDDPANVHEPHNAQSEEIDYDKLAAAMKRADADKQPG